MTCPGDRAALDALCDHLHRWAGLDTTRLRSRLEFGLDGRLLRGLDEGNAAERARSDPDLLHEVLAAVTVGESYFFRNADQMGVLRQRIVPDLAERPGTLQVWSAGTATGEEAYSLAALFHEAGLLDRVRILATDLSPEALRQARSGLFRPWSLRGVSTGTVERYFRWTGARFELTRKIRDAVEFRKLNLMDPLSTWREAGVGSMDLVLCRNVLIYLHASAIRHVARRLVETLRPRGWLILAPSDPLLARLVPVTTVTTGAGLVYRPAEAEATAAGISEGAPWEPHTGPLRPAGPDPGTVGTPLATPERAAGRGPEPVAGPTEPEPNTEDGVGAGAAPALESPPEPTRQIRSVANAGRPHEAARLAADAIRERPIDPELHLLLAVSLAEEGRDSEALAAARRCLYLDPGFVMAHLTLAGVHERRGDRSGARRALRNALRLLEGMPASATVPGTEKERADALLDATRRMLEPVAGGRP